MRVLDSFHSARSAHDIVSATSRFLEEDLRRSPMPIEDFGVLRVESVQDIEKCIDRLQSAVHEVALIGDAEDRVDRLLSYLLVASIRARQLS